MTSAGPHPLQQPLAPLLNPALERQQREDAEFKAALEVRALQHHCCCQIPFAGFLAGNITCAHGCELI